MKFAKNTNIYKKDRVHWLMIFWHFLQMYRWMSTGQLIPHYKKIFLGKRKLPTKMMHMAGIPNVSAFQNGKNQNPPVGPFWENW